MVRIHSPRPNLSLRNTTITKGSGNVFADLGFSPAEARNLRMRSQMMTALGKFIEREGRRPKLPGG